MGVLYHFRDKNKKAGVQATDRLSEKDTKKLRLFIIFLFFLIERFSIFSHFSPLSPLPPNFYLHSQRRTGRLPRPRSFPKAEGDGLP